MGVQEETGQQQGTVIVGQVPPLRDVLLGAHLEAPFNLDSFMAYAKQNHFGEALEFWYAVNNLPMHQKPKFTYLQELKRILRTYVNQDAPQQVNLSGKEREATEAKAAQAIRAFEQNHSLVDVTVFDAAQAAIYRMVDRDQYSKYIEMIVIQKQLVISRQEALWWRQIAKGLTLRHFFTFPNPINEAESRLHNCCTCVVLTACNFAAYFGHWPWLYVYLVWGFTTRILCGPRLDPQAFIVLFVLRPLVADQWGLLKNCYTSSAPKRFAQVVGWVFAVAAFVLTLCKQWIAAWVVSGMFLCAAALAGFGGVCIACVMYAYPAKKGWLPASWCEECQLTYVRGASVLKPEKTAHAGKVLEGSDNASKSSATRSWAPSFGFGRLRDREETKSDTTSYVV